MKNPDAALCPAAFKNFEADLEIDFCLASKDPNGQPTSGITRTKTTVSAIGNTSSYYSTSAGGRDIWDHNKYLNIYVCDIGGGTLGFTYLPGTSGASDDATVIDYHYFGITGTKSPYNKGRTTTHEVGHWFNLKHIWGDANCGNDNVADTPTQASANGGCPAFPHVTCSNGPNGDMFMNYMDYTDDNCMYMFSAGQKLRTAATVNGIRSTLKTSDACITAPLDAGVLSIISPQGSVCASSILPFVTIRNAGSTTLTSCDINFAVDGATPTIYKWTGSLTTGATSNITLPVVSVSSGQHTFTASTSNPNSGSDGNSINDGNSSSFNSTSGQSLPFTEGFEGSFPPSGWSIKNPDNDLTWAKATVGSSGSASAFMDIINYKGGNKKIDELPVIDRKFRPVGLLDVQDLLKAGIF